MRFDRVAVAEQTFKTNGLRNSSSSIWGLKFIRNDELTERMATVSSGFRQFSWTKDKETMLSCAIVTNKWRAIRSDKML